MKRLLLAFVFLAGVIPAASPESLRGEETLALYLVKKSGPNLADDILASTPLLADHDFLTYDTKTQEFCITPQAAERVRREAWRPITSFVIVAHGERVCEGELKNSASVRTQFYGPTIVASSRVAKTDFKIEFTTGSVKLPWGAQLIKFTGAGIQVRMHDGTIKVIPPTRVADLRKDPRILRAIQDLKLPASSPILPLS